MARTPAELARLCDEHWTVARDLLYKGDLEGWLRRSLFRTDLADQAAAIVRSTPDPDEGLERFLHVLNPRLPYPALRVRPTALRFGRIPPGGRSQRTLRVRNRAGRGVIKGTVTADPPVSWLNVPPQFQGEGDIRVTVETGNIPDGTPLVTRIRLKTPYEEVSIPVRGRVAFPWLRALARLALATGVGALVGAVLAFLGTALPGQPRTVAGIVFLALLMTLLRRRSGPSGGRKVFRFIFTALFYGGLLVGANYLGYAAWGWVREADPLAARTLPIGIGALFGLALGLPRALGRPGHQTVPGLLGALVLLASFVYLTRAAYVGFNAGQAGRAGPAGPTPTLGRPSPIPTRSYAPTVTPPGRVAVGMEVEVATTGSRLNIRERPGMDATVVVKADPGTRLEVVGGPRQADGHTWWQVRLPDGTVGWAVEDWLHPVK